MMTELEKQFQSLGIDFNHIAFYDSEQFIRQERIDRHFLEKYGQFVSERHFSNEYITRAKVEIPFIARILNEELVKDGRLGACIDISIGLNRILEREGFWNYLIKGSLTIMLPTHTGLNNKYFWSYDIGKFDASHVWVVAPPYTVIDLSIKQQPYSDDTAKYLPDLVCSDSVNIAEVYEDDLISPEIRLHMLRLGICEDKMSSLRPHWNSFSEIFKAVEVAYNDVKLKYIPIGISVADVPLDQVATLRLSGRLSIEIYQDIIRPQLMELRKG